MKTKLLLLSAIIALSSFNLKGAETTVYTSATLGTAVTNAADGDVIIIGQCDSVLTQVALTVTKHITVKAASGLASKPTLKLGFILKNNSSLRVEGIKFYYDTPTTPQTTNTDSKYGIQAVAEVATIDSIVMVNCEALNFGRGLIRADNTTNIATINKIVIDNCIISNATSVSTSYATIGLKTAKVSNITIRNTTITNGLGSVLYSEDSSTALNLLIDHVTIFNCSKTATKSMIAFKSPAGSNLTVSNSIVSFSGITTAASDTLLKNVIDFSASAGTFSLSNSIICPHLFASKIVPLVKPDGTSASWSSYGMVTVDSLSMNQNYVVSTYPTQLNTIGDPRGYKTNTAVNNSVQPKFKVYPNPASDIIYLDQVYAKVRVINIAGQTILHLTNTNSCSLNKLSGGIYFVEATTNTGQQFVQKISKN